MELELSVEDPRWEQLDIFALSSRVFEAGLQHVGLEPALCEISVLACDDAQITELNAEFRTKPQPTNVLSWPAEDLAPDDPGALPFSAKKDVTGVFALGDIAIAYDTCAREAAEAHKPMADHVTHLLLHGLLHLLGYDHIRDEDATLMEETEARILGRLGIDNPYRDT